MLSDQELVDFITSLIEKSDLNSLTFAKLFEQIQAQYPEEDLSERKKFLRTTVKELVQEQQERLSTVGENSHTSPSSSPPPSSTSVSIPTSTANKKRKRSSSSAKKEVAAAPRKRGSGKEEVNDHSNGTTTTSTSNENKEETEEPKEPKDQGPEVFINIDEASEEQKKLQGLLFEAYKFGLANGTRSSRSRQKGKLSTGDFNFKSKKKSNDSNTASAESEDGSTKPPKKRRAVGPSKMHVLSRAMADFLEVSLDTQMTRTEVVKRLHAYIREHNLQNPKNKREILFDDKLQEVFKHKKSDYFKINKLISSHVKAADEVV